jgi:hypothetical protein
VVELSNNNVIKIEQRLIENYKKTNFYFSGFVEPTKTDWRGGKLKFSKKLICSLKNIEEIILIIIKS